MTRAQLMAMTGIRTPASFAAAVRELMGQSLLSPKDGAPRTSWYLGEEFWGGLLADEELDTPVATLVRGRKAAVDRGRASPAGDRTRTTKGRNETGEDTGAENRTSDAALGGGVEKRGTGVENRTSGSAAAAGSREIDATGIENRTSGSRNGKAKVTVEAFAAEELPRDALGTRIAERLADYYGKRGEYRIARARLRGLAARIRRDVEVEGVGGTGEAAREPAQRDRASMARAAPRSRCRWCSSPFDHPAARGDRGDGVCRGCDGRRSRDGPVQVGSVVDGIGKRLGRGAAG